VDEMNELSTIDRELIQELGKRVLRVEVAAVQAMENSLDEGFLRAVCLIEHRGTNGRVVITGMGKSGHIGRKIAATMSSTGTPAYFMHPAEGRHGDLGMITRHDVVIAISNSGETEELLGILPTLESIQVPMIAMTAKPDSTLARHSLAILNIAVPAEACPLGLAPTASTTATLALGDALSVVLQERMNFKKEDFALYHPAGMLGKRLLLKVKDLMHLGDTVPYVREEDMMMNALVEMSSKKMGMTLVQDRNGVLTGVLTDGDVRRAVMDHANHLQVIPVKEVMSSSPKRIYQHALAVDALRLMEDDKISALVVENDNNDVVGVIHIHDLLAQGL